MIFNRVTKICVTLLFLITKSNVSSFDININKRYRRNIFSGLTMTPLMISNTAKPEDTIMKISDTIMKIDETTLLDPLTIRFYGAVTETSCLELTQLLNVLDIRAKQQKILQPYINPIISLHIQSGGGALMPTFFVCDTIEQIETPVYTYVDGFAASAASLIAVVGKKRFMTKNSAILIHQLSGSSSGKYNELKDEMCNFNFFMKKMISIYMDNTFLDQDTLDELLGSDIWIDSNSCLEYGLIDTVVGI